MQPSIAGYMQKEEILFFDIPRFIMEVVSPSTEKYDRHEKNGNI